MGTPEHVDGDSTPVYGSFEEERFEMDELEEPLHQGGESTTSVPVQDLEVDWQPGEAKSELDRRVLADYGPLVEGDSTPSSPADIVVESELCHNSNFTISEATLNEEDLDIEDADRASSQRKDVEGESSVVQVISPHSDSDEPKSPEPLGLVEELEEEEELEWDRGHVAEVVSYCRECRDMLVNGSVICNSGDENAANGGVSTLLIGEGQKLVVVDSCVLLSCLPLVKEILQDGSCKLYICHQVLQELNFQREGEFLVRSRSSSRWLASAGHLGIAFQTRLEQEKVIAKTSGRQEENGEAVILATCLDLQLKYPATILLTEDDRLGVQARNLNVAVAKCSDIKERLRGGQIDVEALVDQPDDGLVGVEAKLLLRDLLEAVLVQELKQAHGGQLWRQSAAVKPSENRPFWNLETLLMLYARHHPTLLCPAFPDTSHCLLKVLEKDRRRIKEEKVAGSLIGDIEELIEVVFVKDYISGAVEECRDKLQKLRQRLQKSFWEQMPNMTSDAPDEDPSGVESLFQSVWETMAAFTLALASTFKVECSIPVPSHEVTFEGEESAQAVLTDILAKVSNVWEALADCLAAGSATSPTAPDVSALHATLSNFKADSRSGKSPTSTPGPTVTVEQLGRWLRSGDQTEAIMFGLHQVQQMRTTLMACSNQLAQQET